MTQPRPFFKLWDVLSIAHFEMNNERVFFPAECKNLYMYLASSQCRYGSVASSYLSLMRRVGFECVEDINYSLNWLEQAGLVNVVYTPGENGKIITSYEVAYPFPYKIIPVEFK